eukprot:2955364-Ditylum_brightwellii.AAC.1
MSNRKIPAAHDGVTLPDGTTKGTTMIGDIKGIVCNKSEISMKEGLIFAIYISRGMTGETANTGTDARKVKININIAHELLGHQDESQKRAVMKNLGWIITRG